MNRRLAGKPLSEEHRRKTKEALFLLGPVAPWMATAWKPEEDALVMELPDQEVAERTGRSIDAMKSRKRRLCKGLVGYSVSGWLMIDTEHIDRCDFWIKEDSGQEHHFSFEHLVPLRDGQRVSAVYAANPRGGASPRSPGEPHGQQRDRSVRREIGAQTAEHPE